MKIIKTPYFSYRLRSLPKGCQYCVKGAKLVLFLTGLCPRKCCFCPLSEHKYQKDVCFANERPVKTFQDIKTEACLMKAQGAGITGGDPLARLPRTLNYIKKLKKAFGRQFHIHLYTSLDLISQNRLKKLHQAGLDEIRFHLDLDNRQLWPKLSLAQKFAWDVGVEIPVIPGKEASLKQLIDFIHDKVHFFNLNELELADTPVSQLRKLGFKQKDALSYAVSGSNDLGLKILKYILRRKYSLQVHLCPVKLKDKIQLSRRIRRESLNARKPFDLVDSEGLLIRGALYFPELIPSFSYQARLKKINRAKFLSRLRLLRAKLLRRFNLKPQEIFLDQNQLRLLLSSANLKKYQAYFRHLNLKPALVREYPTYHQLEVELEFI